jgi:small subunit ribosomal protein S9
MALKKETKKKKKIKPEKKTKKKKTGEEKKVEAKEKEEARVERYFEAVGRRKTATARVRLFFDPNFKNLEVIINGKPLNEYFPYPNSQYNVLIPFKKVKVQEGMKVSVLVKGGGSVAQSEAIRLGISRALCKFNPEFQKKLKKAGFLTRDPRMRERKKFGLKRARRAPQWQKR